MKFTFLPLVISALFTANIFAGTTNKNTVLDLETLTVNSDLLDISYDRFAASVLVLDEVELQDRGASHFEDVILQLPNVNFSGEGSRPRHMQIRGMGSRDEYVGAPNPNVAFIIDDIDFSDNGMAASLFDVNQVDVFRGPQSSRFGANAFAGLINIRSNEPTQDRESLIELTAGQDDLTEVGLMTSGAFSDDEDSALYRFSMFKHDSDGFRKNNFLGKDDTNKRDELYLRGKLHFSLSSVTDLDITLLHANIDNGNDVWTLDNDYSTETDEPGKDKQESTAAAIKLTADGSDNFTLTSITTLADSNFTFSHDADWVDLMHWGRPYLWNFENKKDRDTFSQELRFASKADSRLFNDTTDWLTGIYYSNLDEDSEIYLGLLNDLLIPSRSKSTEFEAENIAIFGQLDHHLNEETVISGGVRIEHNSQDYASNTAEDFDLSDNLFGAHLSISHQLNQQHGVYASISRGYKVGGFNTGLTTTNVDSHFYQYDKETSVNYEVGLKSSLLDNALKTSIVMFYTDRKNPQFDGYDVMDSEFVFFTDNLDSAENYGIEAEFDWQVNNNWQLFGALGLLETNVDGQPYNTNFVMSGRDQAHAPNYQYNIGTQYRRPSGFVARIDVTGVDAFYYDNVHNFKSNSYTLTNARLGYEIDNWEIYLWGKNIFDQEYTTRGYFMINDPLLGLGTESKKHVKRLGNPRQIGLTARMRF